jgi:hypothetical protein
MAILNKYNVNIDVKRYVIQKAFIQKEGWMPDSLYKLLADAARKHNVDFDEAVEEWDKDKGKWLIMFHGMDSQTAARQDALIAKGDQTLDPDENGMAYVVFIVDIKTGIISKIETESIQ